MREASLSDPAVNVRPSTEADDAASGSEWAEVGWSGWSAGGRNGARCDECGRVIVGIHRGRLFERPTNGDQTLRCDSPACNPNARAADLAVDAPRVAPRVVADPSGAVDSWLETRDAPSDGTARAAGPLGPVPGQRVAPSAGGPGALTCPACHGSKIEQLGQVLSNVTYWRGCSRCDGTGVIASDPAGDHLINASIARALDILEEAQSVAYMNTNPVLAASLLDRAQEAVVAAQTVLHAVTGVPLPPGHRRAAPIPRDLSADRAPERVAAPRRPLFAQLWFTPWSDEADELVLRELLAEGEMGAPQGTTLTDALYLLHRDDLGELERWVTRAFEVDASIAPKAGA